VRRADNLNHLHVPIVLRNLGASNSWNLLGLSTSVMGLLYLSSSYCWASVANAPNVLQPHWLIVLPLDVPALTTSLLYEILAARGGVIFRPSYILYVTTFATSRLREILAAKVGTTWARNGR
jgi:hypothetical protein